MGKKEKLGRDSAKKSKKSTSRSQSDHNAIVKDLSTTLDEAQGAEALAGMSAKKTRSGKEHGKDEEQAEDSDSPTQGETEEDGEAMEEEASHERAIIARRKTTPQGSSRKNVKSKNKKKKKVYSNSKKGAAWRASVLKNTRSSRGMRVEEEDEEKSEDDDDSESEEDSSESDNSSESEGSSSESNATNDSHDPPVESSSEDSSSEDDDEPSPMQGTDDDDAFGGSHDGETRGNPHADLLESDDEGHGAFDTPRGDFSKRKSSKSRSKSRRSLAIVGDDDSDSDDEISDEDLRRVAAVDRDQEQEEADLDDAKHNATIRLSQLTGSLYDSEKSEGTKRLKKDKVLQNLHDVQLCAQVDLEKLRMDMENVRRALVKQSHKGKRAQEKIASLKRELKKQKKAPKATINHRGGAYGGGGGGYGGGGYGSGGRAHAPKAMTNPTFADTCKFDPGQRKYSNLTTFFYEFEDTCQFVHKDHMIFFLRTRLAKDVREVLRSKMKTYEDVRGKPMTYSKVKNYLTSTYESRDQDVRLFNEMREVKQGSGTIQTYVTRLKAAFAALETRGHTIDKFSKRNYLLQGLNKGVRAEAEKNTRYHTMSGSELVKVLTAHDEALKSASNSTGANAVIAAVTKAQRREMRKIAKEEAEAAAAAEGGTRKVTFAKKKSTKFNDGDARLKMSAMKQFYTEEQWKERVTMATEKIDPRTKPTLFQKDKVGKEKACVWCRTIGHTMDACPKIAKRDW